MKHKKTAKQYRKARGRIYSKARKRWLAKRIVLTAQLLRTYQDALQEIKQFEKLLEE